MKRFKIFLFGLMSAFFLLTNFSSCKHEPNGAETNGTTIKNPEPYATRAANLDFIFNNQTLGTTTITMKRSEWNKLCDNYRFFFKNENYVHAEKYEYEKEFGPLEAYNSAAFGSFKWLDSPWPWEREANI